MLFLAKTSHTEIDVCDGALTWLFFHKFIRFRQIFSCKASWPLNNMFYWPFVYTDCIQNEGNHDNRRKWARHWFRATLTRFFRFLFVFKAIFRRLLICLHVVLINPCFIGSCDTFHKVRATRSSRNHFPNVVLQHFSSVQLFQKSCALMRLMLNTSVKILYTDRWDISSLWATSLTLGWFFMI